MQALPPASRRYWMHCASLGEFEQGRPVLEALKGKYPDCQIILSFFSPSGYTIRKNYEGADLVCYLPMDGPGNASRFLDLVQPTQVLFVKYEFWYFYLHEIAKRRISVILVSGSFRAGQAFFKPWGGFFRNLLSFFSILTVQDQESQKLLETEGINSILTGDTRYDRVLQIAENTCQLPLIEVFKGVEKLVIAGSTYGEDEQILHSCMDLFQKDWKLILVPHEIGQAHLEQISSLFGSAACFYSKYEPGSTARVLIIDNMGMLSDIYRYGAIATIGGGFSKSGIHNILEPAVFGLPVIFGPYYQKFSEAVLMVKAAYAFPVNDAPAYKMQLQFLMENDQKRLELGQQIRSFVQNNAGATSKILKLVDDAA